ncbi:MAG TPA: hypothetical protein VGV65_01445 [Nocardioides sp.]|nr:hypothetical protein [Nocardioides sp.]
MPAALRHRLVALGLVRPLVRGVFVAAQVPDSFRVRVSAVAMVTPPHAVVVDRTAAWIHGVDALPRSAIHEMPSIDLYSRGGSRMRRTGVASGIRDLRPTDIDELGPVAVTTRLRTACDLGRLLWRFDALAAIDGFLRQGVDQDELVREVERFKGFRGVVQLRRLAPLGDKGAESPPESALRLHWHEADIPAWPQTQIWVHDDDGTPRFRIDVGDAEVRFGAEYYGEEFHGDEVEEADQERIAWLERRRAWHIEVFEKEAVYGRELCATDRLHTGTVRARATLGGRAVTYVDLAR